MSTASLYSHSSKVSIVGLLAGAAVGFVAGPVLGTIYSIAIAYIPIIYLNALLSGLFGAAIGGGVAFAMKKGKVRNTFVTVVVGFLATAFAHYVGWMVWVGVIFFRSDVEIPVLAILFPISLIEIILELSREGVWTIGRSDTPVSGVFLWIVWILEALIIFGASLLVGFGLADSEPFCEACENWCRPEDDALRLGVAPDSSTATRLLAGDLGAIAETPRADPAEPIWQQVDLCHCPSCGGTNTLTLSLVTLSYDKKGNAQAKKNTLVDRLLLTPEQVTWVRNVAGQPTAQPHAHL